MKKIVKRLSMQQRMTIAFSIPLILIYAILIQIFYGYTLQEQKKVLNQSMEKSVDQAVSFLESYLTNMKNKGKIAENNGVLQDILFSEDFGVSRQEVLEYYDYHQLRLEMEELEVYNQPFRFGLYIPDELTYSNNNYYFYKESLLKERKDYEQLEEILASGRDYIAPGQVRINTNLSEPEDTLTLFHPIRPDSGSGYRVCSISVEISRFLDIIRNSDITEQGLSYLLNDRGECIVSSNEERYELLMEAGEFPKNGKDVVWEAIHLDTVPYYAIRKAVGEDGWCMVSLIPREEYQGQFQTIRLVGGATVIAMLLIIVVISNLLSHYYVNRLRKLKDEMNDLQEGNLNVQLEEGSQSDEIEEVYRSFNYMVTEVRRLMQEQFRLGKNVQSAELRALQAQINPHFLYNTLDLINWIAMDYGASEIEKIAWNLARFYRLSLNHGKSLLTIAEELEHTQVYAALQNYHYEDRICMDVDVPEELNGLACLNITLQPFVENSIVHGIAEHEEITECHIAIRAKRDGEDILFTVADDGPGMTREQMDEAESLDIYRKNQGYGIKNINFRIKLCFGDKYGVHYRSAPGEGTSVSIRIPALTMEEAEEKIV